MPMRAFWFIAGFTMLLLGALGAVLPLLPTTPFLLAAVYAFARSSRRFHDWLVNHPRLGPPIENWRRNGAISRRAKLVAVATIATTFAVTIMLRMPAWVLLAQAAALGAVTIFILTRPDGPQEIGSG